MKCMSKLCVCVREREIESLSGCTAPVTSSFTHMVNNPEGTNSVTSYLRTYTHMHTQDTHTEREKQPLRESTCAEYLLDIL